MKENYKFYRARLGAFMAILDDDKEFKIRIPFQINTSDSHEELKTEQYLEFSKDNMQRLSSIMIAFQADNLKDLANVDALVCYSTKTQCIIGIGHMVLDHFISFFPESSRCTKEHCENLIFRMYLI